MQVAGFVVLRSWRGMTGYVLALGRGEDEIRCMHNRLGYRLDEHLTSGHSASVGCLLSRRVLC